MTHEQIDKSQEIAKRNIHKFREIVSPNGLSNEIEEIRDTISKNTEQTEELNKKIDILISKSNDDNIKDETPNDEKFDEEKKRKQTKGDKIQRYSSDGKTLLETYSSCICVLRDDTIQKTSRASIMRACREDTLYKDYRWKSLSRSKPDDTAQDLPETVLKKGTNVKNDLIAMLNLQKTQIVKVFTTGKEASKDRQFKTGAAISRALRQGTQSGGHYFKHWRDCEEELKIDFLKNNELPVKVPTKNSKVVIRIDKKLNEKKYGCVEDIVKEYNISRKTLKDAITHEYSLKGYKWQYSTS